MRNPGNVYVCVSGWVYWILLDGLSLMNKIRVKVSVEKVHSIIQMSKGPKTTSTQIHR